MKIKANLSQSLDEVQAELGNKKKIEFLIIKVFLKPRNSTKEVKFSDLNLETIRRKRLNGPVCMQQ